jgi:hypothetical protein
MASFGLTIQNKLVEILQLVTVANGYHNNVQLVSKKFLDIKKVTSFPVITVMRGAETKKWDDEGEELYRVIATFGIIGMLHVETDNNDEGKLNDAADELLEDIQEVLLKNQSSLFANTEAESFQIMETEPVLVERENQGYVTVVVSIEYFHDSTNV